MYSICSIYSVFHLQYFIYEFSRLAISTNKHVWCASLASFFLLLQKAMLFNSSCDEISMVRLFLNRRCFRSIFTFDRCHAMSDTVHVKLWKTIFPDRGWEMWHWQISRDVKTKLPRTDKCLIIYNRRIITRQSLELSVVRRARHQEEKCARFAIIVSSMRQDFRMFIST